MIFLVTFVSAVGVVDITAADSPSADPGATASFNVTVDNTGVGTTIPTVTLSSSTLTFGSNTISAPSISNITNLVNSTAQTVSFSLTVPQTLAGAYSGTLTATESGNSSNNDTFSYSLTVNSVNALDVTDVSTSTPLTITGEEKDTKTATFAVENTGSTTFTLTSGSFNFTSTDFEDNDDDNITLAFSNFDAVTPGSTDTVTLTAELPKNIDLDKYSGTVTVNHPSDTTKTDTFKLEVRVQPEVCEDGIVKEGDSVSSSQAFLQIDIDEPDDDDEFSPGDEIDIEVNVENDDDDEMDVVVEAFLYDLDDNDKIASVKSSSDEIDDNDDQDFDLVLKVPEGSNLDEDNEYTLYIKAYEDGDEEENCNEDSIDLDLEKEDDDVVVEDLTLSPSTVSCGETVSATVDVENIGSRDQRDVYIELKNSLLGLDQESNEFDLDEGDDETRRFTFNVPLGVASKAYSINAVVFFDDGDEKKDGFADLQVECGITSTGGTSLSTASLSITESEVTGVDGSYSIPVKVTNDGSGTSTYVVDVNADWANPVSSKTVTLIEGQSSTVFVLLEAKEEETGTKSATVEVKSDGSTVASKSLSFELGEEKSRLSGFNLGNIGGNVAFWIIANIVAIVAVLYVIKIVFLPKK
tara:strand:+ start:222 stop:2132 length:1911 start_codon:yes stop_codon:yes gene_type:complete